MIGVSGYRVEDRRGYGEFSPRAEVDLSLVSHTLNTNAGLPSHLSNITFNFPREQEILSSCWAMFQLSENYDAKKCASWILLVGCQRITAFEYVCPARRDCQGTAVCMSNSRAPKRNSGYRCVALWSRNGI